MTAVLFSFKDGRRDLFGNTTFVLPSQNPEITLFSPILSPAVYIIGQRSFNACTDFKSVNGVFTCSSQASMVSQREGSSLYRNQPKEQL